MSSKLSGVVDGGRRLAAAPFRNLARRALGVERLPTAVRAVLSHFARGGQLDVPAIRLKSRVDETVEGMVARAFEPVDEAIAEAYGVSPGTVGFDYGTKLLRPAELTLGRLYREALRDADDGFDPIAREVRPGTGSKLAGIAGLDGSSGRIEGEFSDLVRRVDRAERVTDLVVVALLDGDMRDAINDDEYDDFHTDLADASPEEVGKIAQSTLEADVEARFDHFPDGVRAAYDRAVDVSEAHQDEDRRFRELLEAARDGDPGAHDRIREEYRDADFEEVPGYFDAGDRELPYLRTQYGRVGVIYEGMIEMYREAGVEIDDAFERSIVLSIIGAQLWLDDIDDFESDMAEGQLTPVTAEYVLAESDAEAYRRVLEVTNRYLTAAREHAVASGATLTAIGIEYIRLSGDPSILPGHEEATAGAASDPVTAVGGDTDAGGEGIGSEGVGSEGVGNEGIGSGGVGSEGTESEGIGDAAGGGDTGDRSPGGDEDAGTDDGDDVPGNASPGP